MLAAGGGSTKGVRMHMHATLVSSMNVCAHCWLTLALTAMDGGTRDGGRNDNEPVMSGYLRLGCDYLPRLCRRLSGIVTFKLPFD